MVMPITIHVESTPTGRMRARKNWRGKMILQMQFNMDSHLMTSREYNTSTRWRDATAEDLNIKFATNINLSN